MSTGGPDLFVICKNCQSEVSPYITECPYCGNRLRRRAPTLPRPGEKAKKPAGRGGGGLSRLIGAVRAPGVRAQPASLRRMPESSRWAHLRPYGTIALVAASCVMYVVTRAEPELFLKMPILGALEGHWWRLFTYQFAYFGENIGVYALVAIVAIGLFGWRLEQRYGPVAVLAVFFGAGVTGGLAALAVYSEPIAYGANAGALGLLAAWAVPDVKAARARSYYEGDLLGTAVFAGLLVAIAFAAATASWLAGVVGGLVGLLAGYCLESLSGSDGAG
ncbi:MAG TPA: rhomboid family intramembrane serine protease [Solirubrobacteraceae bacterium]